MRRIVTAAKVETFAARLAALPRVERKVDLSMRAAVRALDRPIRDALKRGYSFVDIARLFQADGIDLKATTIKAYVHEKSAKRRSKKHEVSAVPSVTSAPKHGSPKIPPKPTEGHGTFSVRPDTEDI